jgi:plasmid segregation protein ParM
LLLSIDVGYGYTKGVTSSGHKVSFPSVVAPVSIDLFDGIFNSGIGHRVNVYTLEKSQEKLVGELALNSTAAQNFVARHEKPADIHDLLLLTAAYLCEAGSFSAVNRKEVELVVGLPISFYRGQKDTLRERLSKISAWVSVDGKERQHISFNKVKVYPQGAGALASLGAALPSSGMVGLIDIGTYTTDFMLFETKGGMPIPILDACGSIEAGIYLAQRAVANEFEKQTGSPLPQRMYQKAIETACKGNSLNFEGRKIDLLPALKQAQKEIADMIAGHVMALWGDRTGFLDMTVFAGGGSIWFGEILENSFSNPIYAEEGVFANAAGYLRMATGTKKP